MQAYDARRGTMVRVREGHWKGQFAGMRGTVQNLWGQSEYAAVDVLLEDGRSELFWLPDLAVVDEDIAVQSLGLMLVGHENIEGYDGFWLPFGYYLERDAEQLILRRPDCPVVTAFSAVGADPFEVELALWEDADQQPALWMNKDSCPSQIWQQLDKNLTVVQEGELDQGQVALKISCHNARVCILKHIVSCDTALSGALLRPWHTFGCLLCKRQQYGIVCYKADGST